MSKRLGKGIEALIKTYSTKTSELVLNISLDKIIPNKDNPREEFDEEEMIKLKDSIFKHGILQALTVREIKNGNYELIAGGRRFAAMSQLYREHKKEKFSVRIQLTALFNKQARQIGNYIKDELKHLVIKS